MSLKYDNSLKKKLCENICLHGKSTSKTAFDTHDDNDFKIISPNNISSYEDLSNDELKNILMKKDIEIARLKKGYMVKGGGMEKKEFISFCKKNSK